MYCRSLCYWLDVFSWHLNWWPGEWQQGYYEWACVRNGKDNSIAFRLKLFKISSSFHITSAALVHKYLLGIKLHCGTHKFTEKQTRGMRSELNKWTASLLSVQSLYLNSKQFLILFLSLPCLSFTDGCGRSPWGTGDIYVVLIVCDWQTQCWFPLLSVWIWVSVSRGPYQATVNNLRSKKTEMNNVGLNWPNIKFNTEIDKIACKL